MQGLESPCYGLGLLFMGSKGSGDIAKEHSLDGSVFGGRLSCVTVSLLLVSFPILHLILVLCTSNYAQA